MYDNIDTNSIFSFNNITKVDQKTTFLIFGLRNANNGLRIFQAYFRRKVKNTEPRQNILDIGF